MVRAVVRQAAGNDYRFETLVAGIVSSPAFQLRAVPLTESAPPRPAHATTQAALTGADSSR